MAASPLCARMLVLVTLCVCRLMVGVQAATMEEFGNLVKGPLWNQTNLSLYNKNLSGPIPPELGSLTNLSYLDLTSNSLSGPIPPELGNLTNLTRLWLYGNSLSGNIPPKLGNLNKLTSLFLGNNNLSGPIFPALLGFGLAAFSPRKLWIVLHKLYFQPAMHWVPDTSHVGTTPWGIPVFATPAI